MSDIRTLIQLRAAVGLLGEQAQHNWWPSAFFTASSNAFLMPVFPRTTQLARMTGIARAASRVHDQYIGVGATYHLFRLPETWEQRITATLTTDPDDIDMPTSAAAAMQQLRALAADTPAATIGPVHMGDTRRLQEAAVWNVVAAYYLYAFEMGERIYPYFRDSVA